MKKNQGSGFFCYMVECSDGSLYTGWTVDPERRVKEHNGGRGALYTRWRRPVILAYLEEVSDRSSAQKRENAIKKLTRGEGVDTVFITADDASLVSRGVEMAKRRGRVVLIALLTLSPLQLTAYEIIRKELRMFGSNMSNHQDVRKAIELTASGQVDVEAIATHQLLIEEAQQGMELARTKKDGAIKVILCFAPA